MDDPNLTVFFLQIAGAAALLIWSVRLVRTGVERAFSAELRLWLRRSGQSRVLAAFTGMIAAMALQSSTAVAILTAGFVASGGIAIAAGLAILLGADLGSALVAKLLLARQAWLIPVLLLGGVVLFLRGHQRRVRQGGRILIGLALIFVSLDMLRAATEPLTDAPAAAAAMQYLARDLLTAFLIGALLAWLVHSSVAAVLLFATL
ncbi:MAG: Na+/Pi-cotransporter, partial [Roseovarius sp.]|nr:Na+/Pi-cotransporter [Roseovarius sp.]